MLRQQWLARIDAAQRSAGFGAASRLALQAVADGVEDPSVFNLAAAACHADQRFDDAVHMLERARALSPREANVLNSLGICLKALGRAEDALEAYDQAVEADPALAAAHFNRGALLDQLNDVNGARAAYRRASECDPSYVEPIASLAWLEARAGNAAAAGAHAERALSISGDNVIARMALASAGLQQGNLEEAGSQLSTIGRNPGLSAVNRSIALGLLGDLKDAEGRPADAFAAYAASNDALRALSAPQFEAPGTVTPLDHARRLGDWFDTADRDPWRSAPPVTPALADPRTHVFLVGFPRSGTTLLENVLAAHPNVVSLEEKDCLQAGSAAFLASPEGLEMLSRLTPNEAQGYRESYWSAVRAFGIDPAGKVFIDKMPLASVALPLIWKLFPDARILFARRDPRDVVLSCFRRRFGMNASMYQLLTLEGAAAYYDAVMRLSEIYRDILPLPQHIVRYESLIDDFEGTAQSACDFLGLAWDQAMLDFAGKARDRGISTPSAAQVARGLNRDGQGVWRRYEAQMAPVVPLLGRWVERFGYQR